MNVNKCVFCVSTGLETEVIQQCTLHHTVFALGISCWKLVSGFVVGSCTSTEFHLGKINTEIPKASSFLLRVTAKQRDGPGV